MLMQLAEVTVCPRVLTKPAPLLVRRSGLNSIRLSGLIALIAAWQLCGSARRWVLEF